MAKAAMTRARREPRTRQALIRRVLCLGLVLLGGMLTRPASVGACTCFGRSYPEHARGAAAVFQGRVAAYESRVRTQDPAQLTDRVHFQIARVWKGPVLTDTTVSLWSGGWCDSYFQAGEDYLVWAFPTADGALAARVGDCRPTRAGPFVASDPDLQFLERPVPPPFLVPLLGMATALALSLVARRAVHPAPLRWWGPRLALLGLGLVLSGALYGVWTYDREYGWDAPPLVVAQSWWLSVAAPLLVLPGVGLVVAWIASLRAQWGGGLIWLPLAYFSGFLVHVLVIAHGF